MNREALIQRVRRALREAPPNPGGRPPRTRSVEQSRAQDKQATRTRLSALFADRARSSGAQVHFAPHREAIRKTLQEILPGEGVLTLVQRDRLQALSGAPLETLLPPGLHVLDPAKEWNARTFDAAACLTPAAAGVAETGSIVIPPGPARARIASLTAPLHVALVPLDGILPDLLDLDEAVEGSTPFLLLTGPSKTADIELELVTGVHGPEALHLVLLGHPSEP